MLFSWTTQSTVKRLRIILCPEQKFKAVWEGCSNKIRDTRDLKHMAVFSSHGTYELLKLKRPKNWTSEEQSSGKVATKLKSSGASKGRSLGNKLGIQKKAKKESKAADILQKTKRNLHSIHSVPAWIEVSQLLLYQPSEERVKLFQRKIYSSGVTIILKTLKY